MSDKRQENRIFGYAKVMINHETPGYIRDISENGCKVTTFMPVRLFRDEPVQLSIVPMDEAKIQPFSVETSLRWRKEQTVYFSFGFQFEKFHSDSDKDSCRDFFEMYKK